MVTKVSDPYMYDPLFRVAQSRLQKGEWEAGLNDLAQLIERYPLEHGLRALNQEMQLRAHIDHDEQVDDRRLRRLRLRRLAVRAAGLALVFALLGWSVQASAVWLLTQAATARANIAAQLQNVALGAKLAEAKSLLRTGRAFEAQARLDEIAAVDPNFTGLETAQIQARLAATLDQRYFEAMALLEEAQWDAALEAFRHIEAQVPNYRDVTQRIDQIRKVQALDRMIAGAEEQFEAEAWTATAAAYENIRAVDPVYRAEFVEDRLFTSYVNAARAALGGQSDSLEALRIAESYFRKALALRPQDRNIKAERELAGFYLGAQADLASGQWTEVITALENVYSLDPEYAQGTARQTLYEAYVARGDSALAGGEYEAAVADYQRARGVARHDSAAVLRLYDAHLKIAEAEGAQRNYEAGVQHYRSAVEIGRLRERSVDNTSLAVALQEADEYTAKGNFTVAYERYRRAVLVADATQATTTHVVQAGEYLSLIASRYRSTVQAITLANKLKNPNKIFAGQELLIPYIR